MLTLDMQRIERILDQNAKLKKNPNEKPTNWRELALAADDSSYNRLLLMRRRHVNVTLRYVDTLSLALDCTSKSILTEDPSKQKGKR